MSIEDYLNKKYYYCGRGSYVARQEISRELLIDEVEAKQLYQAIIGTDYFPLLISFERLVKCCEAHLLFENF